MFPFALILILAGSVILVGISIWARQRQALGNRPELEHRLEAPDLEADTPEAVLVAREYGQLVYVNDHAKQWLDVRTGVPSLEYVARNAQPTDSFRGLFAGDRFATFQIGGRWVEGTSLQIPAEDEIRTVVTLREINGSGNGNRQDTNADTPSKRLDVSASMRIINEIGETVNASLSVEQVLQAILTIISKSVPLDAGEITLWDEKDGVLNQRGWLGNADYVVSLAMVGGAYEMGEGISGWVAKHREPLLISDVNAPDAVEPLLDDNPYSSFVAVPLSLGDRLLGTLELVHEEPGHFGQAHLALMQSIAKPVATAIYNAELYTAQIQRIEDIASLQNVTQERDAEDDVGAVYATMNERIANLIDVEVCGVLLYDEQRQRLVGQAPFHGLPGGLVQALSIPVNENAPAHEIWRRQDYWIANDPEDEPLLEASGISPVVMAAGLENLALIPMYVGQQRLGMIMVANKQALAGFTTPDIQNLRILVAQAAIVVQNVRLFEREQRQNTELAGLQEITHAIGALNNEDEVYVYSDINGRIANLMELQMCGILTYDDVDNKLVAQLPFHGVEDELIADYEIDLDKNEVMAELWEDEEYWYTNRAMADPLVYSADLAEMAERTGVEKTLIASLTVGGQKIGAVQVSNKLDGSDFTDNDARLLLIFATQAAAIIENARLVQEIQARAEEADRLRLIAERAGNLVTMDETLAPVLSEVARLTHSQLAFMSIVNDDTGALVTHPRAVFGAELDTALRVSPDSDTTEQLVTNTRRPLFANDIPDNPAYQSLVERLDIKRLLVVPLSIGDRSLGELGIANSETTYDDRDLEILQGVAAQLAATIDRIRLFEAAGENLNRRVQELDAISNVSHILNETIDLNAVLDAIRQEAARATDVDGATIAMLRTLDNWDEQREDDTPRLAFRVGEDEHIDGLADVERAAIDNDDAIIIEDYGRLDDMTPQPAGSTSAVALIFRYAAIPVGVIHLHDSHADRFDERAVSFLQTLASKASLGFGNAARYQEQMERSTILRQRVEQLNQIFELGQMLQTNTDQDMMLEAIAYSIVQSVGYDVVVITMADQEKGILRRETQAGLPVDAFERSKDDTLRLRELDALLKEELRISESYFYPIETIIEWEIAGLDALSAAHVGNRNIEAEGENVWQDGDMLLVPITGAGGELLGIISLDRPQNNQRPTRSQIEILEIFAHQAAATIENNRLYTSSLESAEQEARLNEMLEDIARTLDVDQIVESVAQNAFRLAPFSRMTVALKNQDEAGYTLHHAEFTTDSTLVTRKETQGDLMHTALGRTIQSGVDYVYTGQNDIDAYRDLTRWHNNGERVSLILPLAAGGEQLGAIHFGSDDERDFDPADFRTLLTRVGNLASVAIQNARLFDRAVNLQAFNESVLESIQQGIVVLDRSGRVISANQFMRDEYGWTEIDADDSRHDLFDYVPDLADPLSDELRTVLETGDPRSVLNLRTNNDGFMVRNFYIYPLMAEETVSGAVLMIEDITERALLEENLESRANQLAALTRASGKITGTLQRDAVIDKALDTMPEVVAHDTMTIWRRTNPETMELVGARGVDVEMNPPLRVSVEDVQRMSHIVETNHLMTIDDLPRFLETYKHALPGDAEAKSWLGVPLISQNYAVGMIVITSEQPNYFTPQSEQAALAFANQVAVSLTNAELFTETRARTERLSVLQPRVVGAGAVDGQRKHLRDRADRDCQHRQGGEIAGDSV